MIMVNLLNWWYTRGWRNFLQRIGERFSNLADYFSIGLLLKTFFAPFRQISAQTATHVSIDVKFRMMLDRLVSRIVGAFVRFFIIIAGIVSLSAAGIVSLAMLVLWPLAPAAPVIGIVMMVMGVSL